MKIVQLVCVYPPYAGGIGTSAHNLSRYFDLETITLKPRGIESESTDKVKYLNPLIRLGHAALPISLFRRLKSSDLIYFHYPFFGVGLILHLFTRLHPQTRLIIQYHMDTDSLKGIKRILANLEKLLNYKLFDRAEKIVVSSLDYIEHSQIKDYYQKHQSKFVAIPFAVDTQKFSPADNLDRGNTKNILFVGGLDKAHYFKGVDNLLRALGAIKDDWQLSIAGSGELENQYRQLAQELGIEKKINFLGKLKNEELVDVFRRHDALVLPSINRHEAFGIVLIEAMACGLAVIASELYGVRSVFGAAEGLKVIPNNIPDLTQKIETIFSDPQKLIDMKKAARKLALTTYDEKIIKNKLLAILS